MTVSSPYKILQLNALQNCRQHLYLGKKAHWRQLVIVVNTMDRSVRRSNLSLTDRSRTMDAE